MRQRLTDPGKQVQPFIGRSESTFSTRDPQDGANVVNRSIPVRICEPLHRRRPFANRTALTTIGDVVAVSTLGSAVCVHTNEHQAAQLMLSYRGNGTLQCDGSAYENPVGCSLL